MIDRLGLKSTVVSASQPKWEFSCPAGFPRGSVGLTPGPATSVTANSIYWWDGANLRWIDRGGTQFNSALTVPSQVGIEFAVSPDDTRIAITEIDFRKSPLHRTTWVEDLGTHAHRSVLFNADLTSATNQSPGWPWGWHGGNPVLYDFPLCVIRGGDQYFALNHPRLVDTGGNRLVSFPECYGGTVTEAGVLCTRSFTARALDWLDWSAKQVAEWPLPFSTVSCDSDLNPAQTRVLASCQPNIYTGNPPGTGTGPKTFLFGSGPKLPGAIASPGQNVHWLDNDLVLAGNVRYVAPGYVTTVVIWSLSLQKQVAAPVDVPGIEIGRLAAIT
jgi:hypothetical protein